MQIQEAPGNQGFIHAPSPEHAATGAILRAGCETTSGVAFHFNQPDTEPPQVMLLAVCPAEGENWRWEYLLETILDTFDRAKKRLVIFDHLRTNPALAHLLPALVAPLEGDNLGPNLDLGLNNVNMPRDARGAAPVVPL